MAVFISTKDYDKIKDREYIELVVEAVGRSPMSVCVCPVFYDAATSSSEVDIKED